MCAIGAQGTQFNLVANFLLLHIMKSLALQNSNRTYVLTLASVAMLAVAVFGLSALFARADTGPTITTTVTNGSNAVVTSAPIGTSLTAGATIAS